MQFDSSLAEAMRRMQVAHRTCDLILGVGDGKVEGCKQSYRIEDYLVHFAIGSLNPDQGHVIA